MKNNLTIALNVGYIKEKDVCPAYIWKKKFIYGKQIILLMIPNKEKQDWGYLAAKKTICITKRNNFKT